MQEKFKIVQIAPELPDIWAATEFFYWDQEVVDILKNDSQFKLLQAAHDAIDWDKYFDLLKDTPFYEWKEFGFLTYAGPGHLEENQFFSAIEEISAKQSDFLKANPDFNQLLHDLHVEVASKMINFLIQHRDS